MPLVIGEFHNGEIAMQYMLICCFDETAWNNLPDAQKDKMMRDYGDWARCWAAEKSLGVRRWAQDKRKRC
jgi:hypothetical protein